MLDKSIAKLLNEQVNKEFFSAYLYLDFANHYANGNLEGYENWFLVQAKEEESHAMLFRQYLLNNGEKVESAAIAAPDAPCSDFREPLLKSLEHERYVTASINTIYEAAIKINDFRTVEFLNWFIKEQGEEEKNAEDNINKFDLFGSDPKGLYLLDAEMKTRVYSPPSLVL